MVLKPGIVKLFMYYESKEDRVDDSISACQIQIKMLEIELSLDARYQLTLQNRFNSTILYFEIMKSETIKKLGPQQCCNSCVWSI